ncbi:hypothetical protein [Arthrobacter sp. H35-D1]|uniref:hypothetical protein n=1 Tax=Arthrobacter sp. H35-D1 TaxID=3046202 RepID=UPI0024BB5355|nr:hypothetical protein [Arthrobacter sp. H35-D1]MDJ0314939.1 hypothetical protein [Arthrobacter sp. H35-D1]
MKSIPGSSVALGQKWQAVVAVLAALALAASGSTPMSLSVKTSTAVTKTMTGGAALDVPGARGTNHGRGIMAGKPRLRCDGRRRRNAKGPKASAHRERNVPIHRRRPPSCTG